MTGTISGTVTDSSGVGIPDVEVMVYLEEQLRATAFTAGDGTYTMTSVTAGSYTVRALADTYSQGTKNNIEVSDGATSTVSFTLTVLDMSKLLGQLTSSLNVYNEVEDKQMHNAANLASSTLIALTQYAPDSSQEKSVLSILTSIKSIVTSSLQPGEPSDPDAKVDYGFLQISSNLITQAVNFFSGKSVKAAPLSKCLSAYNAISTPTMTDGVTLSYCSVLSMIVNFRDTSSDTSDLNSIFTQLQTWLDDKYYDSDPVNLGIVTAAANTITSYLNKT